MQTAASTGKEDIYIQLKPESLGGLAIHLTMTEEGVKAQLRTGSQNIQSLINAEITQLEEALRARDIPIVQMEVLYEQPTANNFLDQRRGAPVLGDLPEYPLCHSGRRDCGAVLPQRPGAAGPGFPPSVADGGAEYCLLYPCGAVCRCCADGGYADGPQNLRVYLDGADRVSGNEKGGINSNEKVS